MSVLSKSISKTVRLSIILLIVTTMLGLTLESKAQEKKLSKEDREAMVAATDTIASLRARVASLSLLMEDTARLHSLIISMQNDASKNVAVIAVQEKQIESLKGSLADKGDKEQKLNQVIFKQDAYIKKYGKPKKWGIGISGGYGLAGQGFGAFIGPSIHYSIFNW